MSKAHSAWAHLYDAAYQRSFGGIYEGLTETTLAWIKEFQPPPARVVDYGAGTGRLAIPLASAGYEVVAVDPCAEMLEVLKLKAAEAGVEVRMVCGRMQDELDAPLFDIATCVFTVLVYLLDESALEASLRRAATALRPGGRLLLDIPSKQVFHSYHANRDDLIRDVQVKPQSGGLYHYEETSRILVDGEWVDYTDSFCIRHWESGQVFAALRSAGFEVTGNASAAFAGSGSDYFVACRLDGACP